MRPWATLAGPFQLGETGLSLAETGPRIVGLVELYEFGATLGRRDKDLWLNPDPLPIFAGNHPDQLGYGVFLYQANCASSEARPSHPRPKATRLPDCRRDDLVQLSAANLKVVSQAQMAQLH
jgi:hypothetical protein